MKAQDIITILENRYPLELQEEWDHSGLQIGDTSQDIQTIMIALNADIDTLKKAIEQDCDMLITHHPFLFKPISLDLNTTSGEFIKEAILNHVVVYSTHTPLDKVDMNDWLLQSLGITETYPCESTGIARIGQLKEPMDQETFLTHVKDCFDVPHVKYAGYKDEIQTVGICGGSGGDFIDEIGDKVDAYITGDMKYHLGEKAYDYRIVLVDVSHHIESIMIEGVKNMLEDTTDCEIIEMYSPDYFKDY